MKKKLGYLLVFIVWCSSAFFGYHIAYKTFNALMIADWMFIPASLIFLVVYLCTGWSFFFAVIEIISKIQRFFGYEG
ncbi:hypothetical protein [Bernardetia sp.]|uniref:hypothetical protein n=1 Tax=Bernardetia sp. TaxID=1937974 RepID=UPI0025C6AA4A|nr:hypothetical protein [Bernardetia sp.]